MCNSEERLQNDSQQIKRVTDRWTMLSYTITSESLNVDKPCQVAI